jgi:hypothetical protein
MSGGSATGNRAGGGLEFNTLLKAEDALQDDGTAMPFGDYIINKWDGVQRR